MTPWTDKARRVFEDYCARTRQGLNGRAVDVGEVLDDLRRHVDEELRRAGLAVVNEEDLRRVLVRLGDPVLPGTTGEARAVPASPPSTAAAPVRKGPGYGLLAFGVVLPAVTFLFELLTGMSAAVLFDPMPSWLHLGVVALVPVLNGWMWVRARRADGRQAGLMGWLNGAVLGVGVFYALLYVPFTPFAFIGLIYFGLGLIALAPLVVVVATPVLRGAYARSVGREGLPGLWGGAAIAFALLLGLQVQPFLTLQGLAQAAGEDATAGRRAVQRLRVVGDEELLRRYCYGQLGGAAEMDVVRWLAMGNQRVGPAEAREVYYRVIGRPFNAVPPPSLYTRAGRWTVLEEEFTWDDGLGGDAVAGRVKGLSLVSSRLDGMVEPEAALVYGEWTLEFKNVSNQAREARAQIALPPGGVVSRLTLWVDGEEREAAFAGRGAVKEAYREVAIVRRRDPVLVTTCGPDRVLMQCFPVPANGGTMKVRLGMTAPLVLDSLEAGHYLWPRFLERNFTIGASVEHTFWLESPGKLEGSVGAALPAGSGGTSWRATVAEAALMGAPLGVRVSRPPGVAEVWWPLEPKGAWIHQSIVRREARAVQRVVVVVDGSVGMRSFVEEMAAALGSISGEVELVVVAGDEPRVLGEGFQRGSGAVGAELARLVRSVRGEGGQDNVPALERAWDLAGEVEKGVVVWVHAPQAVLVSSGDGLRQRMERSHGRVSLYEVQVSAGPDRVVEKLDGMPGVRHVPRLGTLREDLARLFGRLGGQGMEWEIRREKVSERSVEGVQARSRHVERLWAREEIERLLAGRQQDAAVALAGEQQLVTPCSGAVVLETRQQFERHHLTPADATTVPSVPEPRVWALLLGGLVILAMGRLAVSGGR